MQLPMSRRAVAATFLATGMAGLSKPGSAQGQRSPLDLATAVPVEVAEIAAGGSWTDAGKIGTYRVVVVVTGPADAQKAHVVVQWLGMKPEGGPTEVVKSADIKEVTDANLSNAQVSLEAEHEDEVTILVTSYDADAKPTVVAFKAAKPGAVAKTDLPPSVQGQAGDKP